MPKIILTFLPGSKSLFCAPQSKTMSHSAQSLFQLRQWVGRCERSLQPETLSGLCETSHYGGQLAMKREACAASPCAAGNSRCDRQQGLRCHNQSHIAQQFLHFRNEVGSERCWLDKHSYYDNRATGTKLFVWNLRFSPAETLSDTCVKKRIFTYMRITESDSELSRDTVWVFSCILSNQAVLRTVINTNIYHAGSNHSWRCSAPTDLRVNLSSTVCFWISKTHMSLLEAGRLHRILKLITVVF